MMNAHARDWPLARRRAMIGARPFSTLSPSLEITAGSTVTEPTIATATTSTVPSANDVNTALPARNIPAIAVITVSPEMSTARPEVAAARASARSSVLTGAALLELAAQVEHRVVDSDREPDQQHDRVDRALGNRDQ